MNKSVDKEKGKEKELEMIRESKRIVEHERDEKIVEVRDLKVNGIHNTNGMCIKAVAAHCLLLSSWIIKRKLRKNTS